MFLDSSMASHLTQFTSLSSKGSQGSLYLIFHHPWSHIYYSLSLTPFQTHRALQYFLDMPSSSLPQGLWTCCSFCLERSYLGLAHGFLALFLAFSLYERKISMITLWKSASSHSAIVLYVYTPFFFFFSVSINTGNITCLLVYVAVVTFSPPPQLECKLVFFFHLSTLVLRTMSGT